MQADRKTNRDINKQTRTKNRQGETQKKTNGEKKHRARKKGTVEKERK